MKTEEELKKEDKTLEEIFNGIVEEVDRKQLYELIEIAKKKWIEAGKQEAQADKIKFLEKLGLVRIIKPVDFGEELMNDTFDLVKERITKLKEKNEN